MSVPKKNPQAAATAKGAEKNNSPKNHIVTEAAQQEGNLAAKAAITPDYAAIGAYFAELAELPRWVPYALKRNEKRGKNDKIPSNGQCGLSTAVSEHWMTLTDALAVVQEWRGLNGVGVVFTDGVIRGDFTLVGLDFDGVDFENPEFLATLDRLDTYVEISPSGKGARVLAWVPTEWAVKFADNLKALLPGCDHCEIYIGSPSPRFLTVTFAVLREKPIRELDGKALAWLSSHLKPREAERLDAPLPEEGKTLDLACFDLTEDQKNLIAGGWGGMNRSDVLYGLLIRLFDKGARQEDVLATLISTPGLWAYFLEKRRDDSEKAMELAKKEIARAWGKSMAGLQENLKSYNESWAVPEPFPKHPHDAELDWIYDHAPAVLRAYCEWHRRCSIRPHKVFALTSGLMFVQAVIGRSFALGSINDLRPNLWLLLLAPTESGKGSVPRLVAAALDALRAAGATPAIPQLEEAFASAEGLWWHLETTQQVLWADEEFGKTLAAIAAATEGTPRYAMRRALLRLFDASSQANLAPIRYSQRVKSAKEMLPLHYPFLTILGTGVPRDISGLMASAAEDGLLNRFLVVVVDDPSPIGVLNPTEPLPATIMEWAGDRCPQGSSTVEDLIYLAAGPRNVLVIDKAVEDAWRTEAEYGTDFAQKLPGVWGRHGEKVLKMAMLYAALDTGMLSAEGFEWARRFCRWATTRFAAHFEAEGGGAENEMHAIGLAFLAAFKAPSLAGREVLPSKEIGKFAGRAWRNCRDSQKRARVIASLVQDGLIEEVSLLPNGKGYRRLR